MGTDLHRNRHFYCIFELDFYSAGLQWNNWDQTVKEQKCRKYTVDDKEVNITLTKQSV